MKKESDHRVELMAKNAIFRAIEKQRCHIVGIGPNKKILAFDAQNIPDGFKVIIHVPVWKISRNPNHTDLGHESTIWKATNKIMFGDFGKIISLAKISV